MTPAPLPAVDPVRCTGSGACVAVCPTGCLELAGPVPWLPRPRDCVHCGACAEVCPAGAVRLEPAAGPGYDPGPTPGGYT